MRQHGAQALGKLMELSPRLDPLVNELCNNIQTTTGGIQEAMLMALREVLMRCGEKVSQG